MAVTSEFEAKKKGLAQTFDEKISAKLEILANKADFYPHELDELRSALKQMTGRIHETQTSVININYGTGIAPIIDDDLNSSFDDEEDFQIPKIVIQNKPDVERIVNKPHLRHFQLDVDENSAAQFVSLRHVEQIRESKFSP